MNSDLSDIASALTGSLPRDGQAGMSGQLKNADGSSVAPAITFTNETTSGLIRPATGQLGVVIQSSQVGYFDSGGWEGPVKSGVPVGTLVDFAGSTAPTFWYFCYGQAISRTTYATLFAALGTTYGAGDGVTTFNLPDLRGYATVGKTNMGGSASSNLTSTYFGADPTVLGNNGGSQDRTLLLGHLPTGITSANTGTIALATTTTNTGIPNATSSLLSISGSGGGYGFIERQSRCRR